MGAAARQRCAAHRRRAAGRGSAPRASLGVTSSHTADRVSSTGRPYRFQVRAQNEAGWGEWSAFSAPVTPDTIPGRPPTPSVAFGDGQLTVTWAGAAQRGLGDHRLRGRDRRRTQSAVVQRGTATTYVWDGLHERHQLPVPRHGDQRRRARRTRRRGPIPSIRCASPTPRACRPSQRGNRYLDLSVGARARTTAIRSSSTRCEMRVEPRACGCRWATAPRYRWSNLAQRRRAASSGSRSRNRDPDWSAASAVGRPRSSPCGAPLQPAPPTAQRGDGAAVVTYTASGRPGLRDQPDPDRAPTAVPPRPPPGQPAHVHRPDQRHRLHVPGAGAERGRLGRVERRPRTRSPRPASPTGPELDQRQPTSGVGEVDLSVAGRQRQRQRRCTRYQISINGRRSQDVGLATSYAPRRPRRQHHYTFKVRACNDVGCGAWSPTRQAITTWGAPDQPDAPNVSAGDGNISSVVGHPDRQRRSDRQLRGRAQPRRHQERRRQRARRGTPPPARSYRVRVRACNVGGLRAVERVEPERSRHAAASVNVTASYYGSAQGQPDCGSSRCTYVRVERHRACSRTPRTP